MLNPVDLYTEWNTLNGGLLTPGGRWHLHDSPLGSVTLCVKCDVGAWNDSVFTDGDELCGATHLVYIDFSGVECGSAQNVGTFVFRYFVDDVTCPANGYFTIPVEVGSDGQVTISRTDAACSYEYLAQTPAGGDEITLALPANTFAPTFTIAHRVIKRELENCAGPDPETIEEDTVVYGIPKNDIDFDYAMDGDVSAIQTRGLILYHKYTFDISDWSNFGGGYFDVIRVIELPGNLVVDLDLGDVLYPVGGVTLGNSLTFVNNLKAELYSLFSDMGVNINDSAVVFTVTRTGASGEFINFFFGCCHDPSGKWFGIDKTDLSTSFWKDGVGDGPYVDEHTFEQVTGGSYSNLASGLTYTLPCTVHDRNGTIGEIIGSYIDICADISVIYDLAACNFDVLVLDSAGPHKIINDDRNCVEGYPRFSICHEITLQADMTNCTPSYLWTPSGLTTQSIDATPATAYEVDTECDTCEGIINDSATYCFPKLTRFCHFPTMTEACDGLEIVETVNLASAATACAGDAIDWSSITFYNVPSGFTIVHLGAGSVEVTIANTVKPGVYYSPFQVEATSGRKSNFSSLWFEVLKGTCC